MNLSTPTQLHSRTKPMAASADEASAGEELESLYRATRRFTDRLVEPLSAEDCVVQSMDDASPVRWHLAHTTWFFETFLLRPQSGYRVFNPHFGFLFNSYYNSIGKQYPRSQRGLISRPGLAQVRDYRRHVDEEIRMRLQHEDFARDAEPLLRVGIHHEQQHQELILTDVKHMLSCNPTWPAYRADPFATANTPPAVSDADNTAAARRRDPAEWIDVAAGVYMIGHEGPGFAYDNECPRHPAYLPDVSLAPGLVTNAEYLEFMQAGGYERPEFWLSLGWTTATQLGWKAPLYWVHRDDGWYEFTLAGLVPLEPAWPVTHLSYFEADAFARWKGLRLPTEFEWEVACDQTASDPMATSTTTPLDQEPFADRLLQQPQAIHPTRSPDGLMGSVWQWTSSSYGAYPGYRPAAGAVGEYNGKFMCNQMVLRGGSVATSSTHIRSTYRNFFPPDARWQFSGIRLAQ
ncbi:MAG: ergothioneine biosynthesis protein EgtB [Novipirellula sp. JB048]